MSIKEREFERQLFPEKFNKPDAPSLPVDNMVSLREALTMAKDLIEYMHSRLDNLPPEEFESYANHYMNTINLLNEEIVKVS